MKKEFGDCTSLVSLCLLFSSWEGGCRRSMSLESTCSIEECQPWAWNRVYFLIAFSKKIEELTFKNISPLILKQLSKVSWDKISGQKDLKLDMAQVQRISMLVLKLYLSSIFAHLRNWWCSGRSMQEHVKIPDALHLILLVRVVIRCYTEIYFHKKCREVKESILDSSTSAHCKLLKESWYNHNDEHIDKKDSSYSAALQLSDSLFLFLVFANCSRVIKSQLEKDFWQVALRKTPRTRRRASLIWRSD